MTHPTPDSPSPQDRARHAVYAYIKSRLTQADLSTITFEERHVFLRTFTGILGGWSAILGTTLSKTMLYEVIYDNLRGQTILRVFDRVDEISIRDDERY